MNKLTLTILTAGLCLAVALPGFGMGSRPPFGHELVARAEVDECFNGLGEPYQAGPNCGWWTEPKANQNYLWGLTKSGNKLWFGTAANMLCLVRAFSSFSADGDGGTGLGDLLSSVSPYKNDLWACEYQQGMYPSTEMMTTIPDIFGDYRPPKIYTYDINTRQLTDKTNLLMGISDRVRLETTFGLRSAAAFDGMVFLSGPVALGRGINMFVFDAETGAFIRSATLPQYQNIRKWLIMDGVLYAAVADEAGGGKVLRWTGSRDNPFSFIEVGILDGSGAEIVEHNGRIFVGTWPSKGENPAMAGIWMSIVVPPGGLTEDYADSWRKVWQSSDYEPDPLNAAIYGVGAMASYGGYLYWGTMHVHGKAAVVFIDRYNMGLYQFAQTYFNTWRATAIFRGNFTDGVNDAELLYGNRTLPVYVPTGESSGYWTYRQNNMEGVAGKYGQAGFGNVYNNYTWTMAVYNGQLFVGTMDHSYLWLDWNHLQQDYWGNDFFYFPTFDFPWLWTPSEDEYGADLWRFPSSHEAAQRVSRNGLDNFTNYGFRSSVVDENTGLYLGTANPASLYTDRYGNSKGGWELHRVYKQ